MVVFVGSAGCIGHQALFGAIEGETQRERKTGRDEKGDREDADQHGQTKSQDRGTSGQAQSPKDAEGKANGWLREAEIIAETSPSGPRSP